MEAEIQTQEEKIKEFEDLIAGKKLPKPLDTIYDAPKILIEWRLAKGWSQEELAKKAGIEYLELVAYEKRDYEVAPFSHMLRIAGALKHSEPERKVNELEEALKFLS